MAIPTYDQIMLPLLRALGDGQLHAKRELAERMADYFHLTPEERASMLPSTRVTRISHRTGWAAFGLRRAGLADNPVEGSLQITDEGKQMLATNPSKLTSKELMQFEPFRNFAAGVKQRAAAKKASGALASLPSIPPADAITPEERIESAFAELKERLITDLRTKLATVDPFRFEHIVLELLVKMGYGGSLEEAAKATEKTGDEGIDGIINEDPLGLDVIYVQAKRWRNDIGRREIQSFVGALAGKKAAKGIFITTSDFNSNATEYAEGLHQKVILIDGHRLAELMIQYGVGVSSGPAHPIKKIDSDYFDES